jgi:methyl-accepting chemotaxis protein
MERHMPRFTDWYLKWKLLALNIVIVVCFTFITIYTTVYLVRNVSDDLAESTLNNVATTAFEIVEGIRRINTKELQDQRSSIRVLREVENALSNITISGNGNITVLDSSNGQWVVHPNLKGQSAGSGDHLTKILNEGEGSVHFIPSDTKERTIAVYKTYKPFNWIIIASVPVESASGFISSFGTKTVLFFIIVMAFYAFLTYLISEKIIINPLRQINEAFRTGSRGDLNVSLKKKYNDEIGEMTDNFNEFINTLKNIILSIKNTSESILNSSNEISGGNNQLSSATQEMASSLEETAASVEEISASIHDTAENSVKLTEGISLTSDRAEKGKRHLNQMEKAISQVKESSARIGEIVDMVNSIAFHTNLLALNAAVEAARAGEQGKGFAVVANEVRSLAQRSADAASEIKQIIDSNEEYTSNAESITKATSQILMDVVYNIQSNAQEMRDIESRSKEQAKGIKQINSAIMQMDEVTQRNAALVEELASSAMDMAAISKSLNDEVLKFKLSDSDSYNSGQMISQPKYEESIVPEPVSFKESRSESNSFDDFTEEDFDNKSSFLDDDDQFEEF